MTFRLYQYKHALQVHELLRVNTFTRPSFTHIIDTLLEIEVLLTPVFLWPVEFSWPVPENFNFRLHVGVLFVAKSFQWCH